MAAISPRAMVLCSHPGRLLDYGVLLNRLELYHLSLCLDLDEVRKALSGQQRYGLFIYDDFVPGANELTSLKALSRSSAFRQFVLVGSFSTEERAGLFRWAWRNRVPLLRVLDKPLSLDQLCEIAGGLAFYPRADGQPLRSPAGAICDYQLPGEPRCDRACR